MTQRIATTRIVLAALATVALAVGAATGVAPMAGMAAIALTANLFTDAE